VTHDTLSQLMDYEAVTEGDVIFVDWEHDGLIDQVMLVTDKTWLGDEYQTIRVTYQGAGNVLGKTDIKLSDLNEEYNHEALFSVYRPVDYNPNGQ
jgi:hypothetical protein